MILRQLKNLAKNLFTERNAFYIGRGIDYYSACEAALKLKEVSYIQTEGFAGGELKHGTIALIEEKTSSSCSYHKYKTRLKHS